MWDYGMSKECQAYDYWIKLPDVYTCVQAKEVPLFIMNGISDAVIPPWGASHDIWDRVEFI